MERYYRVPEAELPHYLLDKEGAQRTTSVPPGYVRPELVEKLRKEGDTISKYIDSSVASKWPKELEKLVEETENPFIQVLFEYAPKKLIFGDTEDRICLIGDAGHLAR